MITEKDKQLASELGLNKLPEQEQEKRINQYKETLRIRVGIRLEDELDDSQLEEVVKLMEQSGPEETEKWLTSNISNYESIVKDEETKLKLAIKKDVDLIKSILEKF
jgi:uncharacterized protein YdiU (UPF0061 family)